MVKGSIQQNDILAKSNGISLADHTRHVSDALQPLIIQIERLSQIDPDWLRYFITNGNAKSSQIGQILKICAFLHDIGKVHPGFQYRMGNTIEDILKWFGTLEGLHSFVSTLLFSPERLTEFGIDRSDLSTIYSAVAYHHWRDAMLGFNTSVQEEAQRLAHNLLNTINTSVQEEAQRKGSSKRNVDLWLDTLKEHFKNSVFKDFIDILTPFEELIEHIAYGGWFHDYLQGEEQQVLFFPPPNNYLQPLFSSLPTDSKDFIKRTLVLGWLMRADRYASFWEGSGMDINDFLPLCEKWFSDDNPPIILENLKKQEQIQADKIWQEQLIEKAREYRHLILIAPTGSGKSAFALAWAINHTRRKCIFTLPFQAATNKMFISSYKLVEGEDRKIKFDTIFAEDYIRNHNVALIHGLSDFALYELLNKESIDTSREGEIEMLSHMFRHLSLPVLITTGDQILPAAIKFPNYESIYATLSMSSLIIDEVQAYDPRAAAVVLQALVDTALHGGRFLLMTATLPPFFVGKLKEALEKIGEAEKVLIIDTYNRKTIPLNKWQEKNSNEAEGPVDISYINVVHENCIRHKLCLVNSPLLEKDSNGKELVVSDEPLAKEILEMAKSGNRVLVIFNTVRRAETFYNWLLQQEKVIEITRMPENDKRLYEDKVGVMLLHSRLKLRERWDREEVLTSDWAFKNQSHEEWKKQRKLNGLILVATQVVEASLDINADVLFTDMCPADSLVQRMGRVNRHVKPFQSYKEQNNNVYVLVAIPKRNKKSNRRNKNEVVIITDFASGKVYEPALLTITLAELLKQTYDSQIPELGIYDGTIGWTSDAWKDISTKYLTDTKSKRTSPLQCRSSICLSEKDKAALVERVFNEHNLQHTKYYQRFYDTLRILDAGWTADTKHDAHRLFRDISTVDMIYQDDIGKVCIEEKNNEEKEKLLPNICNLIKDCIQENQLPSRTKFLGILANFVFRDYPSNHGIKHIHNELTLWNHIKHYVDDIITNISKNTDEKYDLSNRIKRKLRQWTQQIIVVGTQQDYFIE